MEKPGTDGGYSLTFMDAAGPVLGQQLGPTLMRTHGPDKCAGRPCCIHKPSSHHMVTWRLNWRADTRVMERLCPHGIGHPDPDHMTHVRSLTPEHDCPDEYPGDEGGECPYPHLGWQGTHGCDGCCRRPA